MKLVDDGRRRISERNGVMRKDDKGKWCREMPMMGAER